jgi:hypothetical protein
LEILINTRTANLELIDNSSLRIQPCGELAAHGCLPTRVNLNPHHVNCRRACPYCEMSEESDWHIFFGCIHVEQVWNEAGVWQRI